MESGVTVIFPLLREGKRVDVECRVESGVWTCSDPSLLERLQMGALARFGARRAGGADAVRARSGAWRM